MEYIYLCDKLEKNRYIYYTTIAMIHTVFTQFSDHFV